MEAFATGTPVVAARIGAVAEVVTHGKTGMHFQPGDPNDLVDKVTWMLDHPAQRNRMRRAARAEVETKYTAARNHDLLMAIYERANGGGRPKTED